MTTIKIGKGTVELNPQDLQFTDANLNEFLTKVASQYFYYNEKYSDAQYIVSYYEDQRDSFVAQLFVKIKSENGGSDKLCQSMVDSDEKVKELDNKIRFAKQQSAILWGFLRALDKANQNALNVGYNVRKEMDKLFPKRIEGLNDADDDPMLFYSGKMPVKNAGNN